MEEYVRGNVHTQGIENFWSLLKGSLRLFCGLTRLEKRLAAFVAASDERYSFGNSRNNFLYGGFLATYDDWVGAFADGWEKNVLEGPPHIPYLHMAEIRRPEWRKKEGNGITRKQADHRVSAAFELISETPGLTPITTEVHAGHLLDTFTAKFHIQSGAAKRFMPDYIAFLAYAYHVLEFCEEFRPEAEKVDFLVERSGEITKHIHEFYRDLPVSLESIGRESLIPLLGKLIPGGKDRAPLQTADVLCWHSQRSREGTLNEKDMRRYKKIARREGVHVDFTNKDVTSLWSALTR